MKLVKSAIEVKTGEGFATLMPEEPEDMWHAFNLIRENDHVKAKAIRRVTKTSESGSISSQRVQLFLEIVVTSIDFDASSSQLHVSGKIANENDHVKIGQHHTLDLELNRAFVLRKADGWDSVALAQLKEAISEDRRAELWAMVLGEGIANICMVTEYRTILRQHIDIPVPRKGKNGHSQAMEKFFATTLATLRRQMDTRDSSTTTPEKTLPVLLASPGFIAEAFFTYMKEEATRTPDKSLRALIASVIIAPATSVNLHALSDILSSPAITTKLSDTKYARETALMDKFTELMRLDDARAWYGPREVERAVDKGGVGRGGGVLMISDTLFRAHNVDERRRWVALVERVREVEGGEVRVFSSLHESGKRLEGLGNIAAILTYPIDDMEEEEKFVVEDGDEGEMVI